MGYTTQLTGHLDIEPPLTYAEFKNTPFLECFADNGAGPFSLTVEESEEEDERGTVTIKTASTVEPYDDACKAYDAEERLQRLVDAFPGHEFKGCLEGEGEDAGDLWRLYVVAGRVVKHEAVLTWPAPPVADGSN